MKNLFLKLISIFLILLFCFSPLGAIDLDQGDNSTHVSDNNGTDFKEMNDTIDVDDVDIEVKSVNETDDLKELGNDVKSKRASINETNSSKNLKAKNLKIEMEVDDTTYGEGAVVKVWIKDSDFAYAYDPKVIVQGKYGREVYTKNYFTHGCNVIKLRDDLPVGTYTVTYEFKGAGYWKDKTVTDTFTVKKKSSDLKASIEDVYVGENPVVKLSSAEGLCGDVIISSSQFSKDYNVYLQGGSGTCTIDEDLPAGNYSCSLSYPGDSTHDSQDLTIDFAVNKHDSNLSVQVDDVIENDPFTVKVRADESLNGEVTYLIKSRGGDPIPITRSVKIVDGVANSTLETYLNPGTYSVSAYFDGDDYFEESTAFSTFVVNKKPSPSLNASIEDVYVGEKPVVKISSNEDLDGDVKISSSQFSKDYKFNLQEGSGTCTIDEDLPAGNYTCKVRYLGDRKYGPENLTVNFIVNKHDPNLSVQVDDVFENDPFTVKVRADESLNGEVTYLIKSRGGDPIHLTRSVKIVDGVANSTLETYLNPGTYSVSAYFDGDDYFEESTAFSTFEVDKKA